MPVSDQRTAYDYFIGVDTAEVEYPADVFYDAEPVEVEPESAPPTVHCGNGECTACNPPPPPLITYTEEETQRMVEAILGPRRAQVLRARAAQLVFVEPEEVTPTCDFCGDPQSEPWDGERGVHADCEDTAQRTRGECRIADCPCNDPTPYVPTPADALPAQGVPAPEAPAHTGTGGPHPGDCPACVADANARTLYRAQNNPHRAGTQVAARWDRDRARVDHAMDMRSETYWSM